MTSIATIPAQLERGLRLSFPTALPEIYVMAISLGRTEESAKRETKSPRPSMVQPRKSKPGPRLATVVGAKVLTEANTGSGSGTWVCLEFRIERLQL